MPLTTPAVSLFADDDFEKAIEAAKKDASLLTAYGALFIISGAVVLLVITSILVCKLGLPGQEGSHATGGVILLVGVLLLFLLGFIAHTVTSHDGSHANETAWVDRPGSDDQEQVLTEAVKPQRQVPTTTTSSTEAVTPQRQVPTTTTSFMEAATPQRQVPTTTTKPPIPPYSLVCTVGNDMNESTIFPEDGLCDYTMLEVLPVKLGGPYPKRVDHFLSVASKHRSTQYGIGFDSDSSADIERSLADVNAKSNLDALHAKRIFHFGFINTDIYLFNEEDMARLLGILKTVIGLLADKSNSDRPVYTFMASAWRELSMAQRVSAVDAATQFKNVLTPDLYISKGHYAFHDMNMKHKCRLLPATYLHPPQLDMSEQFKYTFGLVSATKNVADLDKLRDKGVGAPTLSVSVGLYGRWHYVNSTEGTKLEDHRPGSQCLPVTNGFQKTGIHEVCNNPKYRIVDDDKFICKFTMGKTNELLKVMVFDTTDTLRYKVCTSKKNATKVKYGITAAQLEHSDATGHCKNGTFPLIRALKKILAFFKDNYKSEADFQNCVALKT